MKLSRLCEGFVGSFTIAFHGTTIHNFRSIKNNTLGGAGKEHGSGGGLGGIMSYSPTSENEYVSRHLGTVIEYAYDIADDHDSMPVVLALKWSNPGKEFNLYQSSYSRRSGNGHPRPANYRKIS
jgi:hypothetical protein